MLNPQVLARALSGTGLIVQNGRIGLPLQGGMLDITSCIDRIINNLLPREQPPVIDAEFEEVDCGFYKPRYAKFEVELIEQSLREEPDEYTGSSSSSSSN